MTTKTFGIDHCSIRTDASMDENEISRQNKFRVIRNNLYLIAAIEVILICVQIFALLFYKWYNIAPEKGKIYLNLIYMYDP